MTRSVSTLERFVRFGAMGGVGFLLNLATMIVLHEVFGAPEELAFAIALMVVFCFSFMTARYFKPQTDSCAVDARRGHRKIERGNVVEIR